MTNDITYGPALLLAGAYKKQDRKEFNEILSVMDAGALTASTFQLALLLLRTIPLGKDEEGKVTFNLREEAFDTFSRLLDDEIESASTFSNSDTVDMTTAITTITMGSLVPLFEGDGSPFVSMEHEGISELGFFVILAAMVSSMVLSFAEYAPLLPYFDQMGDSMTYSEAQNELLHLLPAIIATQK